MPNSTEEQVLRRDAIRQLLLGAPADTQQALVDELTARGLRGITIGGQQTLTSENTIPEDAWVLSPNAIQNRVLPGRRYACCESATARTVISTTQAPGHL